MVLNILIIISILLSSIISFWDQKSFDQLINLLGNSDDLVYKPVAYNIPITFNKEPNQMLDNAEILFRDQLLGPESLGLAENGSIYTGTSDGNIWRIDGNMITKIASIPNGRPTGMRFISQGLIYFVDAISGIYRIDQNLNVVKIVAFDGNNGQIFEPSKFIDDLVVVEGIGYNGGDVIYYTDVSTKRPLNQYVYTLTEPDKTGRLMKYDINSRIATVIVKGLWHPNGIEVSDDKSYILFCEWTRKRVLKYYISGVKQGLTEILIEGLPGEPNNIRRSKSNSETFWIGINYARTAANTTLFDKFSSYPVMRGTLLIALHKIGLFLKSVGQLFESNYLISVGNNLESAQYFADLTAYPGMAIEIDSTGSIITTLQSQNNRIASLSEIREIPSNSSNRILYMGSFKNAFLVKCTC